MTLNHVRRGSGRPLLLVHGLGAGWRSWLPILDELAERREVIAVDLPGFGDTPPLTGEVSIATLTDSVAEFIREQGLDGVSTVGPRWAAEWCSARPARRRRRHRGVGPGRLLGATRELVVFGATLRPSIALVRALRGMLPSLLAALQEGLCCWRWSARPWCSRVRPCSQTYAGWPTPRRLARPWTP